VMAQVKRSGHVRLKASLVLRDALACELKIPLQDTLRSLFNVENELGVERALHEGKYLDAFCSLCKDDTGLVTQLSGKRRSGLSAYVAFLFPHLAWKG
jgi:hypothetical protein